jgi:hypothetical protein
MEKINLPKPAEYLDITDLEKKNPDLFDIGKDLVDILFFIKKKTKS